MKTLMVVAGVVEKDSKILLLKRDSNKKFYPNQWEVVSGFLKEFEDAETGVLREIKEETNLDCKIILAGNVLTVEDLGIRWLIAPYLLELTEDNQDITLTENLEYKWINVNEFVDFDTVFGLDHVFKELNLI